MRDLAINFVVSGLGKNINMSSREGEEDKARRKLMMKAMKKAC